MSDADEDAVGAAYRIAESHTQNNYAPEIGGIILLTVFENVWEDGLKFLKPRSQFSREVTSTKPRARERCSHS